jgi:hypothetical protein
MVWDCLIVELFSGEFDCWVILVTMVNRAVVHCRAKDLKALLAAWFLEIKFN